MSRKNESFQDIFNRAFNARNGKKRPESPRDPHKKPQLSEKLRSQIIFESSPASVTERMMLYDLNDLYPEAYQFYQQEINHDRRVQLISNGEGNFVLVPSFEDKMMNVSMELGGIERVRKALERVKYSKVQAGILLACAMYTESQYLEPMVMSQIRAFLYRLGLNVASESLRQEITKLQHLGLLTEVKEVHVITPMGDAFTATVRSGFFTDMSPDQIFLREPDATQTPAEQQASDKDLDINLFE